MPIHLKGVPLSTVLRGFGDATLILVALAGSFSSDRSADRIQRGWPGKPKVAAVRWTGRVEVKSPFNGPRLWPRSRALYVDACFARTRWHLTAPSNPPHHVLRETGVSLHLSATLAFILGCVITVERRRRFLPSTCVTPVAHSLRPRARCRRNPPNPSPTGRR
jgi:hypothetical protein